MSYPPSAPQPGQQPVYVNAQSVYAAPQPRGLSITSLVLGLASFLFGFTFLVPLGAIIFGAMGLKREPAGKGMSIAGIILGAVCLVGWVLFAILAGGMILAIFGVAATSGLTYDY